MGQKIDGNIHHKPSNHFGERRSLKIHMFCEALVGMVLRYSHRYFHFIVLLPVPLDISLD